MNIQGIIQEKGLEVDRFEPVSGGDINSSYCLTGKNEKYFLKLNISSHFPSMLEKEARGLDALRSKTSLTVPGVVSHGIFENEQYLILEWIDISKPGKNSWERLGEGIAQLHHSSANEFGWSEDNYIGSLVQFNETKKQWFEFYRDCRLSPLIRQLYQQNAFSPEDLRLSERFLAQLENLFSPSKPSLLHGDLWGGNVGFRSSGEPVIFDPAVYFGHREMDLAMTRLFGGFDPVFYQSYHSAFPLEPAWEQRLPLMQLYPLLVHAILFGSGYISRCKEIIRRFS